MMKNMLKIGLILLPLLSLLSCLKDKTNECTPKEVTIKAPDAEIAALKAYLTENGVAFIEDSRGFFYTMNTAGTGEKPTTCSIVGIDYVAKLTDGTTVDSNNNVLYPVNAFIAGWQEALPLMSAGGNMTLYLPPSLAYGATAVGSIPANSNMIFQISLKSVQ